MLRVVRRVEVVMGGMVWFMLVWVVVLVELNFMSTIMWLISIIMVSVIMVSIPMV